MPIPVIIDCDPGTDDALALLLAFGSPELDLRLITVVGGNVELEHTLANALALTSLAGVSVPVYAGAERPLLGSFLTKRAIHGENGLGGVILPQGGRPAPGIAADAIRGALRDSAKPVTLVGIGPVTNLALALATEPALSANIAQIVLMAGAWAEGNVTPAAEFNAINDPEALAIVLASGRPVTLVTLELTAQALATKTRLEALRRAGVGRCLKVACDIRDRVPATVRPGGPGAALHDPCAVAWLLRPSLFTTRPARASVDTGSGESRGRTNIYRFGDRASPANVTLLETLDADGFFALLAERLARLA